MKAKFILSRLFAALGITAIPSGYIAICVALHTHVGLWAWLLLVTLTIFLPVFIFQMRNYTKYKAYLDGYEKAEQELKEQQEEELKQE